MKKQKAMRVAMDPKERRQLRKRRSKKDEFRDAIAEFLKKQKGP